MRHSIRVELCRFNSLRWVLLIAAAAFVGSLAARTLAADEPAKVSSRAVAEKAGTATATAEHPLVGFIKIARTSVETISNVRDYEARFSKRELVGRTLFADQMQIKFRKEPFSVYLRFLGPSKSAGREVLYVAGRNQGKLLAHEGSGIAMWAGTLSIEPNSPRVMAEGRHPITEIGMQKMVEGLIHQWELELGAGYVEKDPKYYNSYPQAKLDNVDCLVLESAHAKPNPPFVFQTSRLYIDKKTNFPVRLEQWGFPQGENGPYIIEEYTYTDIKPNVGLSNQDFDVRNRKYRF